MTFAELTRLLESKKRIQLEEDKRQASFDYTLAELIGRSISRIYNSSNTMPTISEVYPSLFNATQEAEAIQEKKDELSALRFKQFAQSHNKKYKEVSDNK